MSDVENDLGNKEEEGEANTDFLNMPDDEVSDALPEFLDEPSVSEEEEEEEEHSEEGTKDAEDTDDDGDDSTDTSDDSDDNEEDADESESSEDESSEVSSDDGESDEEDSTEEDSTEDTDSSAQEQLDLLFTPFKANGKQMQVSSIEDARTLMQMGANYDKKMTGLKPSLRIVKMLEKNDLLDESKISYLIDLDKKDPNAISKLLKDGDIDPLEVDVEKSKDYRPNTYAVGDKEVELDGVLDDIRDTSTFQDTVDIISNKWDEPSKQVLVENPGIISVINDHVASGIYEQITNVIESERMMGRLRGVSDVKAYQLVGDEMKARGLFDEAPATAPQKKTKTAAEKTKAKSRKKAASPTKGSAGKKGEKEFNPLALSDEEFEKAASGAFS